MEYSNILQYLQGLIGGKQSQQNNQFGQNIGLQQQQLAQQGSQFDKNLNQQGIQFDRTFGLNSDQQKFQQDLARRQFADEEFNNAVAQSKPQPSWQSAHPVFKAAPATPMFGTTSAYTSDLLRYLQSLNPASKY